LKNGSDKLTVPDAVWRRINEGYTKTRKNSDKPAAIRKDAVLCISHTLSASHEDMMRISSDPKLFKGWIEANMKYLAEEYGWRNVVKFTLHMDETTPHIHVVTVPLTPDGRLSAKEVMGNPDMMSERQTRYAEFMEPFGLERGIKGSKATHENQKEYNGRMKRAQENASKSVPEVSKSDKLFSPSKVIESLRSQLMEANAAIEMSRKAEKDRRATAEHASKLLESARISDSRARKQLEGYNFLKHQMKNPKYLQEQLQKITGQQQRPNKGLSQ
jgi:hypothetical protein